MHSRASRHLFPPSRTEEQDEEDDLEMGYPKASSTPDDGFLISANRSSSYHPPSSTLHHHHYPHYRLVHSDGESSYGGLGGMMLDHSSSLSPIASAASTPTPMLSVKNEMVDPASSPTEMARLDLSEMVLAAQQQASALRMTEGV
jgi:hypothetical protein